MYQITYKNFLIDRAYSKTGKTTYFVVWKLDEENNPFDLWGENFKSIKKAKQFIESEQSR